MRKGNIKRPVNFPLCQPVKGEVPMTTYQQLFHRYYPLICRQLTYLLGNRAAAEDVTQEAFIKLYQSPPREHTNVGGWLSRVATNLAYNYLRSEKSRRLREENNLGAAYVLNTPEENALKNEEKQLIRHAIDALSERDRLCLLMKHSGFAYEEIAAAIGVKKSSVGTMIARAQARFKKAYLERKGSDT